MLCSDYTIMLAAIIMDTADNPFRIMQVVCKASVTISYSNRSKSSTLFLGQCTMWTVHHVV